MRFKEEFLKELVRRLKENVEIIESSFKLADIEFVKAKLFNVEPVEFRLPVLVESNPYVFINKLSYSVVNRNEIRVATDNIACELLLELVNLILKEFKLERIDRIGR